MADLLGGRPVIPSLVDIRDREAYIEVTIDVIAGLPSKGIVDLFGLSECRKRTGLND